MSQTTKATPPSAPAESSNRVTLGLSNRLLARPEVGALVAAIVIFIFFLIVAPAFRSADSFFTVLYQASTIGIVAQTLLLLPYLKASGFIVRPRFDFRGTGLGHTLRLGSWTLGFVIVNQLAFYVMVHRATAGVAQVVNGVADASGFTVYSKPERSSAAASISSCRAKNCTIGFVNSTSASTQTKLS